MNKKACRHAFKEEHSSLSVFKTGSSHQIIPMVSFSSPVSCKTGRHSSAQHRQSDNRTLTFQRKLSLTSEMAKTHWTYILRSLV